MSVVICYDGSASSKAAVQLVAKTMSHEKVVLLHVWEPPTSVLSDAFGSPDAIAGATVERLERRSIEYGREVLAVGRAIADADGLEVGCHLERCQTDVAGSILKAAAELAADIIVIGTHGRTAVQPDLLGSVSTVVVGASATPVLIVPEPARTSHEHGPADRLKAEAPA
jgi:nucleotide-binding universal stress UspA family protein